MLLKFKKEFKVDHVEVKHQDAINMELDNKLLLC